MAISYCAEGVKVPVLKRREASAGALNLGAVSFHHHGWFSPGAEDFPESTGYPGQTGCFSSHGPHGSAAGCRKGIAVYCFSSFDLMILL